MPTCRESVFQHEGVTYTVFQSISPASLAQVIADDPKSRDFAHTIARDTFKMGSGKFYLEADHRSPTDYRFKVTIDITENRAATRTFNILALGNRIGAFFGRERPEPAGAAADEPTTKPRSSSPFFGPKPSVAGDFCRLTGMLIGLGWDYAMYAIWLTCQAVQDAWKSVAAA